MILTLVPQRERSRHSSPDPRPHTRRSGIPLLDSPFHHGQRDGARPRHRRRGSPRSSSPLCLCVVPSRRAASPTRPHGPANCHHRAHHQRLYRLADRRQLSASAAHACPPPRARGVRDASDPHRGTGSEPQPSQHVVECAAVPRPAAAESVGEFGREGLIVLCWLGILGLWSGLGYMSSKGFESGTSSVCFCGTISPTRQAVMRLGIYVVDEG